MSTCPVCDGTGTIPHEGGTLPCPYCRPDEAREAASVYDPTAVTP